MKNVINSLSRLQKKLLAITFDVVLSIIATSFAVLMYFEISIFFNPYIIVVFSFFIINFIISFTIFSLYNQVFRYFSFNNIVNILYAFFIYLVLNLIFLKIIEFNLLKWQIILFQSLSFFMMVIISRLAFISYISRENSNHLASSIFLYGVTENSVNLFNLLNNTKLNRIVFFIDDDSKYHKSSISTVPIKHTKHLDTLIKKYSPNEVIISDKYDLNTKRNIIRSLEKYNLRIRLIPNLENITEAYLRSSYSEPLSLEDLVNRKKMRGTNIKYLFKNKKILVTGAGGTIGSELVRQIYASDCNKLIMLDNSEYNLYSINKEISNLNDAHNKDTIISSLLVNIKDKKKLERIFKIHKPDYVFHAAAYKHVSILEENIFEAVENNFYGTKNLVDIATERNIERFCFVSTDKAVNPKTIMGCSKRLAELYIQSVYNDLSEKKLTCPKFSIVRFGNVFNSSGSVIPLFNQQISMGGPVTVTSKDVERYFMSITEAVNLILQSTELSNDCSIFVLDMGSPIKIIDLARRLIRLSGLSEKNNENPEGDIEIKITGISSYEKITEELSVNNNLSNTEHGSIFKDKLELIDKVDLDLLYQNLLKSMEIEDEITIKRLLNRFN